MKKIIFLLFLLLLPFIVHAEVRIDYINIESTTGETEANPNPPFEGLQAKLDIHFYKLHDSVTYSVQVVNDTEKEYQLTTGKEFSKDKYFSYEIVVPNGKEAIIKPHDIISFYIIATYDKEIPIEKYKNGFFEEDNETIINLSREEDLSSINETQKEISPKDDKEKVNNPNTRTGLIIILAIIIAIISFSIYMINHHKIYHFVPIFIIGLLSIPVTIIALEKISIDIQAHIVIGKVEEYMAISDNNCDVTLEQVVSDIKYPAGATFEELMASEYANQAAFTNRPSLVSHMNGIISGSGTLWEFKRGFYDCIHEVSTPDELHPTPEYSANYNRCLGIHGNPKEMPLRGKTVIKPSTVAIYKYKARIC